MKSRLYIFLTLGLLFNASTLLGQTSASSTAPTSAPASLPTSRASLPLTQAAAPLVIVSPTTPNNSPLNQATSTNPPASSSTSFSFITWIDTNKSWISIAVTIILACYVEYNKRHLLNKQQTWEDKFRKEKREQEIGKIQIKLCETEIEENEISAITLELVRVGTLPIEIAELHAIHGDEEKECTVHFVADRYNYPNTFPIKFTSNGQTELVKVLKRSLDRLRLVTKSCKFIAVTSTREEYRSNDIKLFHVPWQSFPSEGLSPSLKK